MSKKSLWQKKQDEWNAYWQQVKEENGFKHCTPKKLKLNGKYTKLLKAYAKLLGLEHSIEWSKTTFGLGLEVQLTVKNKWYHSGLDVFVEGRAAYVSSMREYSQDAREDTVEVFSEKILKGTFGFRRYIKSFKGGGCRRFVGIGQYELVPRFELHDLPRTEEELIVELDLAGIDWHNMKVQLKKSND